MGKHRNIFYGLAYAGHGINLSTLFGRIIADLYAGNENKWEEMPFLNHHFIPLPPEPLKWVGIQANIAYYRMLDAKAS
jgi:glycine/D-amino acid oxidase-like deaminating enzyme